MKIIGVPKNILTLMRENTVNPSVKKYIAYLLAPILLLSFFFGCAGSGTDTYSAGTETETETVEQPLAVLITSSDYQSSGTFMTFRLLLDVIKENGIPTPDCALFGGDYSISTETDPDNSIRNLSEKLMGVYPDFLPENAVFVQGNHDNATDALTPTGAYDMGSFVVYCINEDDFPSGQEPKDTEQAVSALERYLSEMTAKRDLRPVIVASHLPLHENARADNAGAGKLADVLNRYGRELDILYLFGHNHSDNYDDSIGGSVNYFAVGDTMYVPVPASEDSGRIEGSRKLTLCFSCLNYGYVGYSNNAEGGISTNVLTLGVIQIYPESIKITRYTAEGEYCSYSIPLQNTSAVQNAA